MAAQIIFALYYLNRLMLLNDVDGGHILGIIGSREYSIKQSRCQTGAASGLVLMVNHFYSPNNS